MPKSQVKVTYADGSTETVHPHVFRNRKFNYARYRRSEHWRALRKKALKRDEYCCRNCKVSIEKKRLEVHHLTYDRLGDERLEDLITLCQRCHAASHQWAAIERRARES